MDNQIKHRTFVFERYCDANVDRVYAAISDPIQRAGWSTPSGTATLIYDAADFREGGQDVFRCGSKENPQFTGRTTYISIAPGLRVVSYEVVESSDQILMASLISTLIGAEGDGTKIRMTVQVTSFCGDEMVSGVEIGNNAALDNLVEYMTR